MGRDPEVRRLESGAVVAKIALATTEKYKDSNGQPIEKTEWHNVVAWRGLAEVMEKYFKKGQLVYVEGKISTRKWQDPNNNNMDRWSTEIVANTARIMSSPGGGSGGPGGFPTEEPVSSNNHNSAATASTAPPAAPATAPAAPAAEEGGDLPF
jgi:single-strand DNA-binding protein